MQRPVIDDPAFFFVSFCLNSAHSSRASAPVRTLEALASSARGRKIKKPEKERFTIRNGRSCGVQHPGVCGEEHLELVLAEKETLPDG